MDLHVSVIADIKNVWQQIWGTEVQIVNWSLSGHAWVLQRRTIHPNHINPDNWIQMTEDSISKFQEDYDPFLAQFDGFLCCHPNAFCMLFEKYQKPIVLVNSCRVDMPFCFPTASPGMLDKYIACLQRLKDANLLTIVSNNLADKAYSTFGYNLVTKYIPSLCEYTGIKYAPTRDTFLVYKGYLPPHPLLSEYPSYPYAWSELGTFRGIVHLPYEASTMSMFEHFSAGLPLFFPTLEYMSRHVDIQSVSAYWGDRLPANLSMFANKNIWLSLSDMYNLFKRSPNVHFFDSFEHLCHLLSTFQWKDDREVLQNHRQRILDEWRDTMKPIIEA